MAAKLSIKNQATKYKIMTPEFRVSFPQVFVAKKVNETDKVAKFSVQMLFRTAANPAKPETAREAIVDLKPLSAVVVAYVAELFGPDKTKWPKLKMPWRKGEEKDYDGYGPGILFFGASSMNRPGLVYSDGKTVITNEADFYAGCYARATMNPFYYKFMGNEGISFGLQNIIKTRDGEPFGGRSKPEDDFESIAAPGGEGSIAGALASGAAGGIEDPGIGL